MDRSQCHIDELYSDERKNYAADAPDEKVLAQKGIGAERPILDAFQSDRNQGRNDERVEDDRREYCGCWRMEIHNIHSLEPWQSTRKQGRDNREILGNVV